MPKFLIEVAHEEEVVACIKAVKVLLETGSHFLTNAEFGCHDGVHKGWIIVEVDSKHEAKMIVPRAYRESSLVVELTRFSIEELDEMLKKHSS